MSSTERENETLPTIPLHASIDHSDSQNEQNWPRMNDQSISVQGTSGTTLNDAHQESGPSAVSTAVDHGVSTQTTLTLFRIPVLPNFAQEALERLKKARPAEEETDGDDFQPLKKRKLEEKDTEEDNNEGQVCSICFEPWSNSGAHRIASLKCGHLFGQICIDKWLRTQGKCPQCNALSKRSDIRVIYAKAISVVDTTDRDRALKDLEAEKNLRISAQKAEAQAVLQYQLARTECDRLKDEIRHLRTELERYGSSSCSTGSGGDDGGRGNDGLDVEMVIPASTADRQGEYLLKKTISISQHGNARVMDYNPHQSMLLVSKPSNNHLLPGYGLTKLSMLDTRHTEYMGIHSRPIRDVAVSPQGDGMVLTAGMDKTAKLTSIHANSVVQTFKCSATVWACTWDHDNPSYFYCGLQNGTLLQYDIRNPSDHVTQLTRPEGGACPITSLAYVPLCRASTLSCGGVAVGSLGSSVFWEKSASNDVFTPHALNTLAEGSVKIAYLVVLCVRSFCLISAHTRSGACTCLSFEPYTRHFLASFRPSKRSPLNRHILFQMHSVPVDKPFVCHRIHQFTGGSTQRLLSRSSLFQRPGNDGKILSAFGEEATKSVQIWDVATTLKLRQLTMLRTPALDILPFSEENQQLGVLTESNLFVYQWQWK